MIKCAECGVIIKEKNFWKHKHQNYITEVDEDGTKRNR